MGIYSGGVALWKGEKRTSAVLENLLRDLSLLGYEPAAFARRFLQREDILEALEEGVLAVDKSAGIIFLNDAAAQMLSLDRQSVLGRPLREVYSCPTMERVLRTGQAEYNVPLTPSQEIRVLSDWLPLSEGGAPAGAVGIFRNRTEVTRLTNDLTGVHHLVEAMRAYTHEFTNKLHVILGLLELGQPVKGGIIQAFSLNDLGYTVFHVPPGDFLRIIADPTSRGHHNIIITHLFNLLNLFPHS